MAHNALGVQVTAGATKHLGQVVIRSGPMTMYLEPEQAHALVDQMQAALRELAESAAAELRRCEDAIRTDAERREALA